MTGLKEISVTAYLAEWVQVDPPEEHRISHEYAWYVSVWYRQRDEVYAIVTQAGRRPEDFMICDRRRFYHRDKHWITLVKADSKAREELGMIRNNQKPEEKYLAHLENRSG